MKSEECFRQFEAHNLVVALPTYVALIEDGSAACVTPYKVKHCKVRIEFINGKRPDLYHLTKLSFHGHVILESDVIISIYNGTWPKDEIRSLDIEISDSISLGELFTRVLMNATAIHFL